MREKGEKPDDVVFNEKEGKYDAALKPYATNLGAPVIAINDTSAWKNDGINRVNKLIKAKYDELKIQYDTLIKEFEYNNLVYSAKYSFEPVIGEVYHLYKNKAERPFLSIIDPSECSFNHVGSFRLKGDKIWEKV
ncbi:DUF2452 domain-containing protein [Aquimarina sp. 2201CG1-2-11]|uniref:DUF2452 domain-containing protein n=1 Tax=Aquimarina discodermiae TaxID=3231043 RepID=UPI003461FD67